jgi:hypothetical protein
MLNFLVASQRMALVFYFLPTMYSAFRRSFLRNDRCVRMAESPKTLPLEVQILGLAEEYEALTTGQ